MFGARTGRQRAGRAAALGVLSLALLLGPKARAQELSAVGQWSALQPWPDNATHLSLLTNGKLLSWNDTDPREFHLWDPVSGARTLVPYPGYNMFCAGFSTLADGRLLVAGGHRDTNMGLPYASIYDPTSNSWTRLPDMNEGRWYPTTTALPSGEMLVTAGTATGRKVGENRLPQVFQPGTNSWRDLTGALRTVDQYPMMFVMPNGKVFMAGPEQDTAWLDTSGTGAWTPGPRHVHGYRRWGSAVMYDEGKVMVSGGGDVDNTNSVEVIDLNSPTPTWREVQPMARARKQHNMTLLPDGTVLVTGGSSGAGKDDTDKANLDVELWDPATEKFTQMAPTKQYRGYHSSALLLPDGRVISVGGQDSPHDYELFSPPYLFKGPRPTISSAPEAVAYGQTFTVGTPDAASISKVTWIRIGSDTHAFNQGQRINRLAFTRDGGSVRVTAPANANLAPPGDYMLFLLNGQGVPSVSRWVKVSGPDALPAPEVPAIHAGEGWKYDVRGVAPEAAWTSASFDDSSWRTGTGSFGTGSQVATPLALESGMSTAYFRKKVVLRGAPTGGRLVVQAADGVAVWLNGTRVYALNVGEGTDPSTWATAAAVPGARIEVTLPSGALVDGENQLAVMVKRARPTPARPDPALSFDLELVARLQGVVEAVPVLALQAPNGGEMLEGGSLAQIGWSTHGSLAQVRLESSADEGATWQSIAEAVDNSGSYTWRVPPLAHAQLRVRVAGASALASSDTSDASFTVHTAADQGVVAGGACDASAACRADATCVGTPGVCRAHCSAAADCGSGEACTQWGGEGVCLPAGTAGGGGPGATDCTDSGTCPGASNGKDGGRGAGGCTAAGALPSVLGLLLVLGCSLRRRRS